jgi:phage baseplate assembly protein W
MDGGFPYRFDTRGRTFSPNRDAHVRDMIEQLIFTNAGERVNRPDLGSGLQQMVFTPNSPELAATLQFTLQSALQFWLGDVIEVRDLEVTSQDSTLTVTITYLVRSTGQVQTAQFDLRQ